MAIPRTRSSISAEAYLEGELRSEVRHEFMNGQVFAMVGASVQHNRIALNIASTLHQMLANSPCEVFVSDMKVHIRPGREEIYYYPDVMVCCDPEDSATYFRERPCLLVEVSSEHTERIDRREKLWAYMTIPSLQAYLMVSQDRRQVTLFLREEDWNPRVITAGDLTLPCLTRPITLDEIYAKVTFED